MTDPHFDPNLRKINELELLVQDLRAKVETLLQQRDDAAAKVRELLHELRHK